LRVLRRRPEVEPVCGTQELRFPLMKGHHVDRLS
jgi:hypothetical protein